MILALLVWLGGCDRADPPETGGSVLHVPPPISDGAGPADLGVPRTSRPAFFACHASPGPGEGGDAKRGKAPSRDDCLCGPGDRRPACAGGPACRACATELARRSGRIAGLVPHSEDADPAAVYIERIRGITWRSPGLATVRQKGMRFIPKVMAVQIGTKLTFTNEDYYRHNVRADPGSSARFDLGTFGRGETRSVALDRAGMVILGCRLHRQMKAHVVVLDHPYFTSTSESGRFTLEVVPPGTYRLVAAHHDLALAPLIVKVEKGKTAQVRFRRRS